MNKFILFFLILLTTISCVQQNYNLPHGTRNTFVKIEKSVNVLICKDDICEPKSAQITGSGVVVASRKEGSYVLTAAHVCDSQSLISPPFIKEYEIIIETINMKEEKYISVIIGIDFTFDTCILFVSKLHNEVAKISRRGPAHGERVYNVAAPVGIFYKNAVPILEGFFMGNVQERDVAYYSIPATGGSSGSPIFNSRGYLIGMIHSVNVYFPMVSVSPTHKNMKDFISTTIRQEMKNYVNQ